MLGIVLAIPQLTLDGQQVDRCWALAKEENLWTATQLKKVYSFWELTTETEMLGRCQKGLHCIENNAELMLEHEYGTLQQLKDAMVLY